MTKGREALRGPHSGAAECAKRFRSPKVKYGTCVKCGAPTVSEDEKLCPKCQRNEPD